MAKIVHVLTGLVPPSTPPTDVNNHYTDVSAGATYFSAGTASVADWVRMQRADEFDQFADGESELWADLANATDPAKGAGQVGFTHGGAGASPRNLREKVAEIVSTADGLSSLDARAIALSGESAGFWDDDPTPGRLFRFTERAFFGDAATEGGGVKAPGINKSWVGYSASGKMTYFESRATVASFSKIGAVAIAGASQSSDNVQVGELNTIGGGFFANNNNANPADKKSAWAIYGHAAQSAANTFTAAMELDTCSLVAATSINSYAMALEGASATAWLGVGGEVAQGLVAAGDTTTLQPVSCAVGIINSASSAPGNRYAKGIVFQASALLGSDGVTGTAVAMELAKGHELSWRYSGGSDAIGGKIRSDNTMASSQVRQVFSTAGLKFMGVNADLTTEVEAFRIAPLASAANFLSVAPALTGGSPKVQALGSDANIDLMIEPKGGGLVRFGTSTAAATVPANFVANRRLAIKDGSGTTYYIPVMGSPW